MAAPWQQFDTQSEAFKAVVQLATSLGLRVEIARTLRAARRNGTAWIVDPTLRQRVGRGHTLSGLVFDLAAALHAREAAADRGRVDQAHRVLLVGEGAGTLPS